MSGAEEKQIAISVLIPIVERHDDVREVYRSVVPEMEKIGRPYEFVFLVSAEFTEAFDQALELHDSDPKTVRVLRFARPVSEAAALATGFERARGKVVFTVPSYSDADPAGYDRYRCQGLSSRGELSRNLGIMARQGGIIQWYRAAWLASNHVYQHHRLGCIDR